MINLSSDWEKFINYARKCFPMPDNFGYVKVFGRDIKSAIWADEELEKRKNLLREIFCSVPYLHAYLTEEEFRQLQRIVQDYENGCFE